MLGVADYFAWSDFQSNSFEVWIKQLRNKLDDHPISMAIVFVDPRLHSQLQDILEIVQIYAQSPILIGCTTNGLVANENQFEHYLGVSVGLYSLPGAQLKAVHLPIDTLNSISSAKNLCSVTGVSHSDSNGWLIFASPYRLHSDELMRLWNAAYSPKPVVGGVANLGTPECPSLIFLNGKSYTEGLVAVNIGGEVSLKSRVAQGSRPFGDSFLVTKAENNYIYELNDIPAYEVFHSVLQDLNKMHNHLSLKDLHIGLLMDPSKHSLVTDRYLVRSIIGTDPFSGALVVGGNCTVGQSVQFQIKDPRITIENWIEIMQELQHSLASSEIIGALLCSCPSRGLKFFNERSREPKLIESFLGPLPLCGSFLRSEFGPVGEFNFVHSQVSTLALFVKDAPKPSPLAQ